MNIKSFGDKFTDLRIDAGYSLRNFCLKMNLDAGNWSRIESGISNPPTNDDFYDQCMTLFGFDKDIKAELMALALATKITPKELQESELMEHLPVMLRKINGDRIHPEEVDKLVEWIKQTVTKEHKA